MTTTETMTSAAQTAPETHSIGESSTFRALLSDLIQREIEANALPEGNPAWEAATEASGHLWDALIATADAHTARAVSQATRSL